MFEKNTTARHKNEHRVLVTLAGQAPFEAYVFLKVNERLIDLLNDQRQFIPIKRSDGATLIASKQNIVSIVERVDEERLQAPPAEDAETAAEAPPKDTGAEARAGPEPKPEETAKPHEDRRAESKRRPKFDPYEILRVARDAEAEEIRKAYHARMKQVHPDAIASLDLGEDLERAANITARRLNRAYEILMRDKAEPAKEENTAA